jgi:antibiotic biosynthesis monooxygenase (ABM) superfamily enzyme
MPLILNAGSACILRHKQANVRGPTPAAPDTTVTVVTTFHVRPGREAELETFFDDIGRAVSRFPGYLGRRIIRPKTAAEVLGAPAYREVPETRTQFETDAEHDLPEYVSVFRFDSYPHLRAWLGSAERRDRLEAVRPLLLDEERKDTVLTGLERWFTLPWAPDLPPPPRIKMVTLTILAAYLLGYVIVVLLGPWLTPLPMPLRAFVMTALMVFLLTWVVMPRMTRLFRHWLYPSTRSEKLARRRRPPMFAAR